MGRLRRPRSRRGGRRPDPDLGSWGRGRGQLQRNCGGRWRRRFRRRCRFGEQRPQAVELVLRGLPGAGHLGDRVVELAAQFVPFLLPELAHRRPELGFGALVGFHTDLLVLCGARGFEIRDQCLYRARLGGEPLLRLDQPHVVVRPNLAVYVLRRRRLARLELRDPLLVLAALGEERLDVLQLFRRVGHSCILRGP